MIKVLSGVPQGSHLGPLLFIIVINEIVSLLKYVKCLIYADDLKIFLRIKHILDSVLLQSDLNIIADWCRRNFLLLNIKKCFVFTAHRLQIPKIFTYNIESTTLVRQSEVKDLGIIFDCKFTFSLHIDYIINKANSMLGFLKRNCVEISNPYALKSVYMSLVRPFLEYCSIIWYPSHQNAINRIERVQKNFTRYVVRKLNWDLDVLPPYSTRCALIGIESLAKRRSVQCIMFVYDVFCYRIICPQILEAFSIYVPQRVLRQRQFFHVPKHNFNYGSNEPLTRCIKLFNTYEDNLDLSLQRTEFKINVMNYCN